MRKFCLLLLVCLLLPGASLAQVERCAVLDAAFSMLEEGNVFLRRYNDLTGANVQPLFRLGVPYFFGGVNEKAVFAKYPDYTTRECWENTTYYVKDQVYIMGWDCGGFTKWVWKEAGRSPYGVIADVYAKSAHSHHLFCDETLLIPTWDCIHRYLEPGDLLAGTRGAGRHIMMYIGTLRDYGFTAEEVPLLASWLDYPLVIHSSMNPLFGPRFQELINQSGGKYARCATTDGGVCVAILGLSFDQAQFHQVVQKQEQAWFELDGGKVLLTLVQADTYVQWAWYR